MIRQFNVKFEHEDYGVLPLQYWEKVSIETKDSATVEDICESIFHHDFQVLSKEDPEASVTDVEWLRTPKKRDSVTA